MVLVAAEAKSLLIRPTPIPDESFMGYVMRLTEDNGYDTPAWILNRSGINSLLVNVGCSFVFSRSTNLTALAGLAGCEEKELVPLLCPPAGGQSTLRQEFFGQPIPKYLVRLKYSKVCSACLSVANYHRKIWDLAAVTVCPIHECLLLDVCPGCNRRLAWFRKYVSVCRCGYQWHTAPKSIVSCRELFLTRTIYKHCGLLPIQCEVNPLHENSFLKLNLEEKLVAILAIAGQYAGIIDTRGRCLATSLLNKDLHILLMKGFSAFEDWPCNYYKFLDWKRGQKKNNLKWGINQDFEGFHDLLKRSLSSKSFDFMKIAFEEYIKTRWDGGLVFKRSLPLTQDSGGERKYLSQAEVIQELRVGDDVLNRLLDEGVLKHAVRRNKTHKVLLFDRESVQKVKRLFEQLLTADEAAKFLDLRVETVLELVQNGCLKAFDGPSATAHRYEKIHFDELKRLTSTIDSKIASCPPNIDPNPVVFKKAIFKVISHGISVSAFVKGILDGEISPCEKIEGTGLSCYGFNEEHLRTYIKGHRERLKGSWLQIREVVESLSINFASASFFIKERLLCSRSIRIGNSTVIIVSAEAIEAFKSTYVLAAEIARGVRTSAKFLIRCMERNGVKPLCGRGTGRKVHYVYKRSDVERLNIRAIVSEAKAGKVLKRDLGEDRVISLEEASDLLNTNVMSLRKLVRRKIVKPYSEVVSSETGKPYYHFRLSIIEEVRNAAVDCNDLITTSEAAKMLGESDGWFIMKWAHPKRVRVIKFKHAR